MNYAQTPVSTRPPLPSEIPASYEKYHYDSLDAGDVDPSYEMLRYLSNRFELNVEQRYWIAFLYATCYCGPTTYYIYNEFPDFENVDVARLQRWWDSNKQRLMFQTDRRWIRSRNQFVDVFLSYRQRVGRLTQEQLFRTFRTPDHRSTYERAWAEMSQIYQFGRFAMFLYLEAVNAVTEFPMRPPGMDMREAESCRNGLAFAIGRPDLSTYQTEKKLSSYEHAYLQSQFKNLVAKFERDDLRNTVWNIETTLCAYKKYRYGKRWVGYYLDRQADEISTMQAAVPNGVNWSVLWQYRAETYRKKHLKEKQ